jgi:hypothetical protein
MRVIRRSYRIRIYPNGAQRRSYRECGLKLMGYDISRWLTQWKGTSGHEWLKLVPATCVDARDTCPEEILAQVLADEARSGQCNRACMQQASWH